MKKMLLTLSALLMAGSAALAGVVTFGTASLGDRVMAPSTEAMVTETGSTRANSSVNFTYAGDPYTAYSLGTNLKAGNVLYEAIEMPKSVVSQYKGNAITKIIMYSGTDDSRKNPDTKVTVFLSQDLSQEPAYTQDAKISSTGFGKNTITLTDPFEITDDSKPLYIGFYFKATASTKYCLVIDGVPLDANSGLYAIAKDDNTLPTSWANMGPVYGSLCIGAQIEGESIPSTAVACYGVSGPICVKKDAEPGFTFSLRNCGLDNISDLEIKVECEGEETYEINQKLSTALKKNSARNYTMMFHPFTSLGDKTVKFTIMKANGVELANPAIAEGSTVVLEQSFQRNVLLEEFTGTGCGFCPAGIVMLDYLKEKYGNRVNLVAIHNYGSDVMSCPTYKSWVNTYPDGAPYALINRAINVTPGPDKEELDPTIDAILGSDIYAKVEFEKFEMADNKPESKSAQFTVSAEFSVDSNKAYNVAVVTVQDGMGPFTQTNYYCVGNKGPLPGHEDWGSQFKWVYDDVAREMAGYMAYTKNPETGKTETITSFPITDGPIVAGTKYTKTVDFLSMNKVTDKEGKFHAVVILTDAETGEVINCSQLDFNKNEAWETSGVKSIMDNAADAPAVIYNMNGFRMAGSDVNALPAGIYIVKNGNKTQKVLVK